MKRKLRLNPNLPRTWSAPIDPETGKVCMNLHYQLMAMYYDGDQAEEYDELVARTKFEDRPYIAETTLILGQKSVSIPGVDFDDLPLQCHPDTYAEMSDEKKATFELVEYLKHETA